ncbi:hypothetical protein Q5P01_013746 [Channa striata]|uniref:Uncharacterized protein n=1 Tax=Channa striata TaxID=64152 RepID=A0AA88ML20_CHASR|nr:hypothetical protein Q5P01_013746 [Channa striata]
MQRPITVSGTRAVQCSRHHKADEQSDRLYSLFVHASTSMSSPSKHCNGLKRPCPRRKPLLQYKRLKASVKF